MYKYNQKIEYQTLIKILNFRIGLREKVAFWFWAQFQMVVLMAWQSTCRE